MLVSASRGESVNSIHSKIAQQYIEKSFLVLQMSGELFEVENNRALKELFETNKEALGYINQNKVRVANVESMMELITYLNSR